MNISKIIRTIIATVSCFLLVWVNLNFITAGTIIGSVLFGGIIALCVFWKPFCRLIKRIWSKIGGKIALIFIGTVIAFCAVCCSVFSVKMAIYVERPIDNPQAVIVLGCQVRGETPSIMLENRLDTALETLNEYPDTVCVVSGGKGKGEDISEAEAMRRYLTENGIPESRIINEDKSKNTRENISFSKEILDERGIDRAIIVTNDFHQYRADIYARRNGLTIGHHSAETRRLNLLNYWVREWAALFDELIRG